MIKKIVPKNQQVSVVIPCFNDHKQIVSIVNEIKKSKRIYEIIIVDDGSEIETKNKLSSIKEIELITQPENKGKSKSMLVGLENTKSPNVFFIDADLKKLKSHHVKLLIDNFFRSQSDMTLGFRKETKFFMWLGFSQAYTGERIIKKSILLEHTNVFSHKGYLIEPALNQLFFHKYKVSAVRLREVVQTFKVEKRGIIGLLQDFRMYKNYFDFLGWKEFSFQMNFAKKLDI